MIKKILAILTLATSTASAVPLAIDSQNFQFNNYLPNAGSENGKSGVVASGGVLSTTQVAADVMEGKTALTWDASAASQTLTLTPFNVNGLAGLNGEATCFIKGAGATHTMGVWDGTNLINAKTISNGGITGYVPTTINFIFGASGTATIRFTSVNANEPLINIDGCYMGQARNIGSVAQAQLLDVVKITGCATTFSTTAASYSSFPTQAGCLYTSSKGLCGAPTGSNIPAIKCSSIPSGEIRLEYEGLYGGSGSAGGSYFQFFDGTNAFREDSQFYISGASPTIGAASFAQTFLYTVPQSNITFEIRGKGQSGQGAFINGSTQYPGTIRVYYFPTQSQQAIRPDNTTQAWYGQHNVTAPWSTNSSSLVDVSNATGVALAELVNRNFGVVTTAAGNLPGITFTPNRVGLFKVCAYGIVYNSTAGGVTSLALTDGTTQIAYFAVKDPAGNDSSLISLCGLYNITNNSPKTLKLQLAASTGNSSLSAINIGQGRNITWEIFQVDQAFPAPLLTGSVTSNSPSSERIERISFGGPGSRTAPTACTSTPCTIYDQSGSWVSSVTRNATGDYTLNVVPGMFSAIPTCQSNGVGINISFYVVPGGVGTWSTTSLRFGYGFNGTLADGGAQIICMGPR